jgi:hypothetical protein
MRPRMEALKTLQAAAEAEELRLSRLMHENMWKEENRTAREEYFRVLEKGDEVGKAYAKLSFQDRKAKSAEHYLVILEQSAAKKAFDIVCVGQEAYDAYKKAERQYYDLGQKIAEAEYAAKQKK